MNIKANYKKGKRRELIQILLAFGAIPYDSLKMLNGETRIYTRTARKLRDEGVVEVKDGNGIKAIYIKGTEGVMEYETEFPRCYIDRYQNITIDDANNMKWNRVGTYPERIRRKIETQIMMHTCGVKIMPDDKPSIMINDYILNDTDSYFYNSVEIKDIRSIEYQADIEESDEGKKVTSSRIAGIYITPDEVYSVYNIGNKLIEWKVFGELKMAQFISLALRTKFEKPRKKREVTAAIILAKTEEMYYDIITERYNKDASVSLMNINYAYQEMYAIPLGDVGKKYLKIMQEKQWKEKMRESILEHYVVQPGMNLPIDCDGYKDGVYILLFCIPDLVKLKKFVNIAALKENKSKYQIYCFTHQLPTVLLLARDYAGIYSQDFEEYLKTVQGDDNIE